MQRPGRGPQSVPSITPTRCGMGNRGRGRGPGAPPGKRGLPGIFKGEKRTVLNPISYWLDRPQGQLRQAAAELARRIAAQAGLDAAKLDTFLRAER